MVLGKPDNHRQKKLDPYLMPLTKINSKWIKDLNKIIENVKLLDQN